MKLTVLGSGTFQPELNRHSSCHLIQIGKENLIFDFGRGALGQLMKVGVKYQDIDAIFISHFHADHYNDLSAFLQIALAEPHYAQLRKKDLVIYLPVGELKRYKMLLEISGLEKFKPKFKINIKELKIGKTVKTKNWQITGFLAKHSASSKCFCYRLGTKNKIFAYSGDTEDCSGLKRAVKNADLALIEASHPDEWKPEKHLSAESAAKIAQECGVKKLVLTHMSPYYLKNYKVKKLAQKYFRGPIILAKDLLEIEI